jgi:hypothetical protein
MNTLPTIDVQQKIIQKRSSLKKKLLIFVKIVENQISNLLKKHHYNRWVINANTQQEMHFVYLFLNFSNFKKLNLKLHFFE